ncbi:MAG: hypothetical protein WC374_11120 [Phycisphaerae bacterium]|jgi:hypothetical protein
MEIPDWLIDEIVYRWQKARDYLNSNPRAILAIALASGFIFLLVLLKIFSGPSRPVIEESKKAWYYDLNTQKLFVAQADLQVPIDAPSGPLPDGKPAGVRAHVFTYAYEPNENDLIIGYLEMPDPNFVSQNTANENWTVGKLLCRPGDERWVPAGSSQGSSIMREASKRSPSGKIPRYYEPK